MTSSCAEVHVKCMSQPSRCNDMFYTPTATAGLRCHVRRADRQRRLHTQAPARQMAPAPARRVLEPSAPRIAAASSVAADVPPL